MRIETNVESPFYGEHFIDSLLHASLDVKHDDSLTLPDGSRYLIRILPSFAPSQGLRERYSLTDGDTQALTETVAVITRRLNDGTPFTRRFTSTGEAAAAWTAIQHLLETDLEAE